MRVAEIEEELDADNNYRTFLTSVCLSVGDFKRMATSGYPFARAILEEGIVLYDDGSYSGVRDEVLTSRGWYAGRRKAHVP